MGSSCAQAGANDADNKLASNTPMAVACDDHPRVEILMARKPLRLGVETLQPWRQHDAGVLPVAMTEIKQSGQIPMLPSVTMISLRMAVVLGCDTSSCEMD